MRNVSSRSALRIVLALSPLLLLVACGPSAEQKAPAPDTQAAASQKKAAKKAAPSPDEPAVPAAPQGENAKAAGKVLVAWMDDIPSVVPRFEKGTPKGTPTRAELRDGGTGWKLTFRDVTESDLESYLGELAAAGFSVKRKTPKEGVLSATGSRTADGNEVTFMARFVTKGRLVLGVRSSPRS